MKSLNQVNLIGNIGNDPEVRTTQGGEKVANFSLATSVQFTPASGTEKKEKTSWHRIVAWKQLADIVDKYVKKGERIFVSGSIEYSEWTDKEGNKRYSTEIKAREIILLGSPSEKPASTKEKVAAGFDDFPAALEDMDDSLPF